jgi:hypothetical protein
VESTLYFISTAPRGTRNVFLDPYRVTHFVKAFYRCAELELRDPAALLLVDLWVSEYSEEDIALAIHRSRSWVHRRVEAMRQSYHLIG